jgi:hypothetical protein
MAGHVAGSRRRPERSGGTLADRQQNARDHDRALVEALRIGRERRLGVAAGDVDLRAGELRGGLLPTAAKPRDLARHGQRGRRHRGRLRGAVAEDDRGGDGEDVRLDGAQVPRLIEGDPDRDPGAVVAALAEALELAPREHRRRHHEPEAAAGAQVLLGRPHDEEVGEVLVGRDLAARPEASRLRHPPVELLHPLRHEAVGEPGRVADEHVDLVGGLGERGGAGEVADVVAPDVVPPFVVEVAEGVEDGDQRFLVVGVDGAAAQGRADARPGGAALPRGGAAGELGDELVEAVGVGDHPFREVEFAVDQLGLVGGEDRDPAAGEQGLVLLPAEAVAEVDRDAERRPLAFEVLGADRQQVGDPGEGDGDGVEVHAGDVGDHAEDRLLPRHPRRLGRAQVAPDGPEDEGPRAAGGVEDALLERVGHRGLDHALRQPVGGVVLAQVLARVGVDHGLVEGLEDVVVDVGPVEARDPAG